MKFIKVTEMVETKLIDGDVYLNTGVMKSIRDGIQTAEHCDPEVVTVIEFLDGSVLCVKEKLEDVYFKTLE